jgi:parallel beta-helix repeat protein
MGVLRQQGGGGGGSVASVNGQVGVVVLDTQDLADIPFITVVPTGTNDDVTIQAAIDAAGAAGGGVVQLLEGTYQLATHVCWDDGAGTSYNNVILQGVGDGTVLSVTIPKTDPATNPWALYLAGQGNSAVACNATTQLATTITTTTAGNASGFAANSKVCITGYMASGAIRKETNQVVSTDAGTGVVTLKFPLQNSLATTVTMTEHENGFNNGVQNLKIVRGTTSASHALALNQQWGSFVKNVTMDGLLGEGGVGFSLIASVYCDVTDSELLNWFEQEEYPTGNFTHIGTDLQNSYACNFSNNKISNCSNASLNTACVNVSISDRCVIENNTIQNCIIGVRIGNFVSRTSFKNNYIPRATRNGIAGTNGTIYEQLSFEENTISGSGNFYPGILLGGASGTFKDIRVAGNKVSGTVGNDAGIHLQRIVGGSVIGNIVTDNGQEGIYLNECDRITASGNECNNNTYAGLTIYACSDVTINGNALEGNARGIVSFGGSNSDILITGNTLRNNATAALVLDNGDANVLFTGNACRGATITPGSGTNINIIGNL